MHCRELCCEAGHVLRRSSKMMQSTTTPTPQRYGLDLRQCHRDMGNVMHYRDKWPPLQVLVASGQFFCLDEFLKSCVDINSFDEDGYTPIHRAVLGRKETAVSQLLRAGADANILDKDGASFLHYSVQMGSLKLVRLFVNCGVDVNHSDENGWSALHVAALTGREDIIRHLLVCGADKHQKTKEGHTPLDLCLAMGKGYRTFAVAKNLKRSPRENMLSAAELELEEGPTARK